MRCTTKNYDLLYERYLENPGYLLDLGWYDPKNDRLLDLAGGTGIVSENALLRGGIYIELVDILPRINNSSIISYQQKCEDFLFKEEMKYSLIVCRQAINYMNVQKVFEGAWKSLLPGGRFVFNTFLKPKRAKFISYAIDSKRYSELSIFIFDRIFHWQILKRPRFMIDFTSFKYYDAQYLKAKLFNSGFRKIEKITKNRSVYFIVNR